MAQKKSLSLIAMLLTPAVLGAACGSSNAEEAASKKSRDERRRPPTPQRPSFVPA